MSLLMSEFEPFVFLDKTREPDGYGGYVDKYIEGAEFEASMRFDTSIQARIAQKDGVTSLYTMTYKQGLPVDFHDVVKRLSDGKIFRITSDGKDSKTPKAASFALEQVTAEEWKPNG